MLSRAVGSTGLAWLFHKPCVRSNGIATLSQEHNRLTVSSVQADITRLALPLVPKMCAAMSEPRKHHGCYDHLFLP